MQQQADQHSGSFVVSLDFELYWGVRDSRSYAGYQRNILGVHEALPRMLELFARYGIRATWAYVGFLLHSGMDELRAHLPEALPTYSDPRFSPYAALDELAQLPGKALFAPQLVRRIAETPGQELASHSYSHYYCLEAGQSVEQFRADLSAHLQLAAAQGHALSSLVLPRNQVSPAHLAVARALGFSAYRGAQEHPLYAAGQSGSASRVQRALRLADAYLDIAGPCTPLPQARPGQPLNIPASRFLRPLSRRLGLLEPLRLARITKAMGYAARRGRIFHLWWHPHNFGAQPEANLAFLQQVLEHYRRLADSHGLASRSMRDIAESAELP